MNPNRRLVLLALVCVLPGCSLIGELARSSFATPKLEYQSWSAEKLDAEGVTIALRYAVTNPSSRGFRLSRVGWALDLEGKPAARGDMPLGLEVPANGTAPLVLPVRFRWGDLPGLVRLVTTQSDAAFLVKGTAALATPLGEVDVPFSKEGRIDIPRPPGVMLDGVRVRELSLGNVSLDVRLRLSNGNRFALPVGALAWGLRLDGSAVASGENHPLSSAPPGGSATVTIPVRVSLVAAGNVLRRLIAGEDMPMEVNGKAGFGDLQFPFEAERGTRAPQPVTPPRASASGPRGG